MSQQRDPNKLHYKLNQVSDGMLRTGVGLCGALFIGLFLLVVLLVIAGNIMG